MKNALCCKVEIVVDCMSMMTMMIRITMVTLR